MTTTSTTTQNTKTPLIPNTAPKNNNIMSKWGPELYLISIIALAALGVGSAIFGMYIGGKLVENHHLFLAGCSFVGGIALSSIIMLPIADDATRKSFLKKFHLW